MTYTPPTSPLRVLLVGSGAREHALAWKLRQSPLLGELAAAPGNPGIERFATLVPISADDVDGIARHASQERYDFAVVGPEDPLAAGLVDRLESAGVPAFGPTAAAARVESSKSYTKEICEVAGIPTAHAASFTAAQLDEALGFARAQGLPVVLKADGLFKGKGVVVASTWPDAEETVRAMLVEGTFGEAGRRMVIEEYLEGPEVSLLAFCDGVRAIPMLPVRDHKRAYDGDRGPNTGGMGAFAPARDGDPELAERLCARMVQPALDALRARGAPFRGVLFAGCVLTPRGPMLIEFNCRFGDPETEVLMPLLESDLLELLLRCRAGDLTAATLRWRDGAAAGVVMASRGYPGPYPTGIPIRGIDEAESAGALVFHAGTARRGDQVVTAGGRVVCVCATGDDVEAAAARAYAGVSQVAFEGAEFRRDIGRRMGDRAPAAPRSATLS